MTNDRDDSEFVDGDVLGEEVNDDDLPGAVDFPPDRALGVDDPSRDFGDDVATRELRRSVEHPSGQERFTLVDDAASEGLMDVEAQEVAAEVDASADELSPEESALHIVDEERER
jgi:hypothetical protein